MCDFRFVFTFSMNVLQANRIAPDGTPRFAASHLGLFCLPMSHKKDERLKRVKYLTEAFLSHNVLHLISLKLLWRYKLCLLWF